MAIQGTAKRKGILAWAWPTRSARLLWQAGARPRLWPRSWAAWRTRWHAALHAALQALPSFPSFPSTVQWLARRSVALRRELGAPPDEAGAQTLRLGRRPDAPRRWLVVAAV